MLNVRQRSRKKNGATMVEAAIVLPIFLVMAFGFMEVARMFLIWTSMNFALHQALNAATRNLIDSDLGLPTTPRDEIDAFGVKLTNINQIATGILERLRVASGSQGHGRIRLIPYTCPRGPLGQLRLDVAVLRPGESCSESDTGLVVNHITRPYPLRCATCSPGETMSAVINRHPIELKLRARVPSLFPFLPAREFRISAYGYTTSSKFGASFWNPPIPGSPTPDPTIFATPSPSPQNSRTPTPSPTETPSPSPTPSPTPDCSGCYSNPQRTQCFATSTCLAIMNFCGCAPGT